MRRREFLKALMGMALFPGPYLFAEGKQLPRRPYGKTGIELSIIGLGGVSVIKIPQRQANNIVHWAIDHGLNYVDVAPTYGNAEEVLGIALKGYRDKIFLACKTLKRTKKEALQELHNSLKRLKTDHVDLYQFHAISKMEDVEKIFGPGGAMEAFLEAKEKGLIRFIGFSAHSVKAALAAMDRFRFDSVLFPINFTLYFKENFGPQVIRKAQEKGTAVLAIKALAKGRWPKGANRKAFPKCWYQPVSDPEQASMALRFTLSQPVTAAIPPGDERLFQLALKIALDYKPIRPAEIGKLRKIAQTAEPIFKLDL